MSSHEIVGIDIAAKTLTVACEGLAPRREHANDATGRGELVKALCRSKCPVRVVLEATGI